MPSHSIFLKLLEAQPTLEFALLGLFFFKIISMLYTTALLVITSHDSLRPQQWILKVIHLSSFYSISLCICLGVLQVAGWSSWKSRVWVMSALSHIPGHDNSMTRVTTEESQDNEWNQTMRGAKINWANTPTVQNGLVPGHHPCEHPAP